MTTSPPPPLTPPDCDLRDFRYMPLDVVRFSHSDLVSTGDPEAVLAAIRLWSASWHQVPAASLTNDDRTLAQLAGYGRAVAAWQAVKAEALRGFIECSDGRLYHPVVAEKARESFQGKLRHRHRTFTAAVRKHNERNPANRRASPTFEEWLEAGRPETVTRDSTKAEARQDELDLGTEIAPERAPVPAPARTGAEIVPAGNSRDMGGQSRVTGGDVTRDKGGLSRQCHGENPSKGEGEGEGEGIYIESPQPPLPELTASLAETVGLPLRTDKQRQSAEAQVQEWLTLGVDAEAILFTLKRVISGRSDPTRSLKRFDAAVRHDHAKAIAARPSGTTKAPTVDLGPDDPDQRISGLRTALRQRLGARTYDGWVKPGRFTLNGSGVIVTMPSNFMADWLLQHFTNELAEEAGRLNLGSVKITTPLAQG